MAAVEKEARQLEKQSARPGLWDDAASAQTVMKRLAEAQETVSTWRDLGRAGGDPPGPLLLGGGAGRRCSGGVFDVMPGDEAGIKSATLEVGGRYAYGRLRSERGVHRLVRLSPFDADHARHPSFALVEVMPALEGAAEVSLSPDELRIHVFRASGHGGQNVPKKPTAVRVT